MCTPAYLKMGLGMMGTMGLHVTLHPKRVWSTVVQPPPWLDSSLCTSATILDLFAMHSALCFLHLPQISENHLHNIILPGTVSCLLAMRQPCTQHFNVSALSFFVQHHTIRYSVHSDVWEVRGLMILWYVRSGGSLVMYTIETLKPIRPPGGRLRSTWRLLQLIISSFLSAK